MEIPEILKHIERSTGHFEKEAVEAAFEHGHEIASKLTTVIENLIDTVESSPDGLRRFDPDGNYTAHLYAILILCRMTDKRAHALILRFAALPMEAIRLLCGDFLRRELDWALALTLDNGDIGPICAFIENRAVSPEMRSFCLTSLARMENLFLVRTMDVAMFIDRLFQGKLERRPSRIWYDLAITAASICGRNALREIERANAEGLIPDKISRKELNILFEMASSKTEARLIMPAPFMSTDWDRVEQDTWFRRGWHPPELTDDKLLARLRPAAAELSLKNYTLLIDDILGEFVGRPAGPPEATRKAWARFEKRMNLDPERLRGLSFREYVTALWRQDFTRHQPSPQRIEAGKKQLLRALASELEKDDYGFSSLYHSADPKGLRDLQLLAAIEVLNGETAFEPLAAIVNGWSGADIKPQFLHNSLDRLGKKKWITSRFSEPSEPNEVPYRVFRLTPAGITRLTTANQSALARVKGEKWDPGDPSAWFVDGTANAKRGSAG